MNPSLNDPAMPPALGPVAAMHPRRAAAAAWLLPVLCLLAGCGRGPAEAAAVAARTPVTVAVVRTGTIERTAMLNVTARFLQKNAVRAPLGGRVERSGIALGDHVEAGRTIYVLRTKEADALAAVGARDSSFHIGGLVPVPAPASGIVVQVDKLRNDYVTDGDQLAVIADAASAVFVMEVPFEWARHVHAGAACTITLPDSSRVKGTLATPLSVMDPASQTQSWIVRPQRPAVFPEGLNGTSTIPLERKEVAQILPAECVLGDEEMTHFWVMRLLNDSVAVKVPVQRGIVNRDSVEIAVPRFAPGDRFLLGGAYGLPDTANVLITPAE